MHSDLSGVDIQNCIVSVLVLVAPVHGRDYENFPSTCGTVLY